MPIGVIGIAVGTVLLPEMARRITAGDADGAREAQRKAFNLTLLLSMPFVAAFLAVPDAIMRALFARGAFTPANADAAGATLAAYALGLIPFVLIRAAVTPFYARHDTTTPMKAALAGVAVNVALKIALMGSLAQIGLALATAAGAWVNLLLVVGLAVRAGYLAIDGALADGIHQVHHGGGRARRDAVGDGAQRGSLGGASFDTARRNAAGAADWRRHRCLRRVDLILFGRCWLAGLLRG